MNAYTSTKTSVLSALTIAALKDTNFWDAINENFAEPIFWGKSKGCYFW